MLVATSSCALLNPPADEMKFTLSGTAEVLIAGGDGDVEGSLGVVLAASSAGALDYDLSDDNGTVVSNIEKVTSVSAGSDASYSFDFILDVDGSESQTESAMYEYAYVVFFIDDNNNNAIDGNELHRVLKVKESSGYSSTFDFQIQFGKSNSPQWSVGGTKVEPGGSVSGIEIGID
ncbi:hypothetical protein L21SP2_1141 [Salinispira pacifica]|uniref:EF-hand domain-containing protein n=2 Tax=Salinispira pacifica TaxID=1307761 RepID=V5WG79_9SPIO|nr:hypothetical protein L21SP2_1141 [Salinispira pacifica]